MGYTSDVSHKLPVSTENMLRSDHDTHCLLKLVLVSQSISCCTQISMKVPDGTRTFPDQHIKGE